MIRDKMRSFVEKHDELGDRFWLNDIGGPAVTVGIAHVGEDASWMKDCVGLVDEEEGGMIAYGPTMHMRALADKLNKLHAIEEMLGD
jgi:hypothetical protein